MASPSKPKPLHDEVNAVEPDFRAPALPRFTTPERLKIVAWLQRYIAQLEFEAEALAEYKGHSRMDNYIVGRYQYVKAGISHFTVLAHNIEKQADCENDFDGD